MNVFYLFCLFVIVKCCIPNRQVDGTIPLTTVCSSMAGTTTWWMSAELLAVIENCSPQSIAPVATCAARSCAAGSYNYYTGTTNPTPMTSQVIGSVYSECCSRTGTLCFCTSTGECFTPDAASVNSLILQLIPYCSTPTTCVMLGWLSGGNAVGDRGTTYTSTISVSFLITNPITSASCGGCPAASSC